LLTAQQRRDPLGACHVFLALVGCAGRHQRDLARPITARAVADATAKLPSQTSLARVAPVTHAVTT
jgi:hypothetical protein